MFSPDGADRRNLFCHTVSLYAANRAIALTRERGVLLDFGCGTGRMLRYFGAQGWSVIGTEITPEMIDEARRHGLPQGATVHLTDGVAIPLPDQSVDMVWVCGVLKYSLFEPGAICRGGTGRSSSGTQGGLAEDEKPFVPVYRDVAREMYRVLRPGGWVVNNEVYVDAPPEAFTRDFEDIGFVTREVHVLQRYYEPFAKFLQSPYAPRWLVAAVARLCTRPVVFASMTRDERCPACATICSFGPSQSPECRIESRLPAASSSRQSHDRRARGTAHPTPLEPARALGLTRFVGPAHDLP